MKFSFLIPVYNKEEFLDKCISSILNQKYTNYEIIFVDDASTDNSVEVIKKYLPEHKNFILHENKVNKKISYNRNKLIELSSGDFLIFVDPDDYISDTLLEDILEYCNNGIDLIKVHIEHVNRPAKDDKDKYNFYPDKTVLNNEEAIKCFLEDFKKHYAISGSYIIKRSVIDDNNIRFPEELSIHEDVAVTPIIISYSKKVAFVNKIGYYYVENVNGISNSFYKKEEWKEIGEAKKTSFQKAITYALENSLKSPVLTETSKKRLVSDLVKRAEFSEVDDKYKKYLS